MTEPLSAERLARMRVEHVSEQSRYPQYPPNCAKCYAKWDQDVDWPCDAALLLAELDRREANPPRWQGRQPVPHLAGLVGVHEGLCGPRSAEDLC